MFDIEDLIDFLSTISGLLSHIYANPNKVLESSIPPKLLICIAFKNISPERVFFFLMTLMFLLNLQLSVFMPTCSFWSPVFLSRPLSSAGPQLYIYSCLALLFPSLLWERGQREEVSNTSLSEWLLCNSANTDAALLASCQAFASRCIADMGTVREASASPGTAL